MGAPRGLLSLSSVFIDPELLPRERLADCFRAVLARPLRPMYDPQGLPALRALVAARLNARGFEISAEEVIITTGSQQAIDLVARALVVPHIAHEDPVYSNARALFDSLKANTCPLPLDPFVGPDLQEWEARIAAERPSLLYAITSYHNPTGHSYSSRELSALLRLSERYGFALFEDDWGSDMLSGSEYRPTLRALGGPEVLYANSFTKKLLPSLRLGFLVASRRVIPALVAAKRVSILGNSLVLEAALAEFLERGYYDAHLSKAQAALDARYQLCLELLRAEMPEDVRFTTPGGGPTLWLELPRRVDLVALQQKLASRGVHIEDTRSHFAKTPHLHGFRIGYAFLSEEDLARGLRVLAGVLREPEFAR
jgi:DNA-binding transcriptional MocR family regulator